MTALLSSPSSFRASIARAAARDYVLREPLRQDTEFTYNFENFFHPFVEKLKEQLNRKSLPGMLDPIYHQALARKFFATFYTLLESDVVKIEHFQKEIDLSEGGPYANYNWELLFHVPLTIAVHLSKNQRFAEAQRWFHYIFDPTSTDATAQVPTRFWRLLAFRKQAEVKQIDEQLTILSKPLADCTPEEIELKERIVRGFEAIKNNPFQPHAVARTRQLAYQYCVVMKYLDNLIAWGDSLFRQDTVESINEATQLYVLAANLLGQRPQRIPPRGNMRAKTFAELKKQGLDALGNALVALEGKFPLSLGLPQMRGADPDAARPLFGIGHTLYFCIPRNEKMLSYWDTVADRLFKIRHCMNVEGVVRQLALYDPPLDPGMLVKAAAAGIDIGSIVNGLNQPASPVRSLLLIQKALELCGEVRGLGGALLAAIEKGDAEHLALLRQNHEVKIQEMQQQVRFLQWASAQETTKSLLTSRQTALERLHYYQRLLGLPADPNAPDTVALDFNGLDLNEANFAEAYEALVGQYDKTPTLQSFPNLSLTKEGRARLHLTAHEDDEFVHLMAARDTGLAATIANSLAAGFAFVPDAKGHFHFWGMGASSKFPVGTGLVAGAKIAGDVLGIIAAWEREQAGFASKTAAYERRADEWMLQHNLAAHDLVQIGRQILTSLIAEQVTHHEYLTIKQQILDAQKVESFLHEKFSNAELYAWMQGEISRLYYEYYRFAFDIARKAELAMKRELMREEVNKTEYVKFNYWDGGRKGLLAGESLYLDVKRMELAYHENNKREYELTKNVSLLQVDPLALVRLRTTGSCTVELPETLFDMDGPGHYFRRIKTVALSIPCVTGPYASVNCTLTLLKSSIRKTPVVGESYAAEDDRFSTYLGSLQSIVTSSAQNDSGLFETNLHDERYLPFEGSGAISQWKLSLPANPSQDEPRAFDYDTIADVILHLRYTAREGGQLLGKAAVTNLKERIDEAQAVGSVRLLSVRHEFPTEWAKFKSVNVMGDTKTANLSLDLRREHFPYWSQNRLKAIRRVDVFAKYGKAPAQIQITENPDTTGATDELTRDRSLGNICRGQWTHPPTIDANKPLPVRYSLNVTNNKMDELWLAVTWAKQA